MSLKTIKSNKGITLIALIITIIVLLILAVVSIGAIRESGIITHAEKASSTYKAEQEKEKVTLAASEALLANNGGAIRKTDLVSALDKQFGAGNYDITGEEAPFTVTITNGTGTKYTIKSNGSITTPNENNTDDEIEEEREKTEGPVDGVTIPAGFYGYVGQTKEEGIIITDGEGNQYVWVPVTKDENGNPTEPYIESNGKMTTSKGEVEIQLGRYEFDSSGNPSPYSGSYKEDKYSYYGNAVAEDIEKFKESVSKNGGYFIGRYEVGIESGTLSSEENTNYEENWTGWTGGTLVVKSGKQVWNHVTKNKASELCRNIDKNYTGITSDLVNSYAWDTAIVFIQECSGDTDYSRQTSLQSTLAKTGEATDGINKDVRCNIYDMAGNCIEWTTETSSNYLNPSVIRGGDYDGSIYPSYRKYFNKSAERSLFSFRPLLYWRG